MTSKKSEPEETPEEVPQDDTVEEVTMEHPDLTDSRTTATRAAYDEVWAEKGWVIVEDQGEGSGAAS